MKFPPVLCNEAPGRLRFNRCAAGIFYLGGSSKEKYIMKRCSKCKQFKPLSDFYKCKIKKDGYNAYCKACAKVCAHQWLNKNKEQKRKTQRQWRAQNPHYDQEWRNKNKEKRLESDRQWRIKDPEKTKEIQKKKYIKQISTPAGKLNRYIGSGISHSLKGSKTGRHWEALVSYTLDQLKKHLEKQFTPEMTWENYGRFWHVDHKTPVSVFNFGTPEHIDFKKCWALKNLQPLEAKQNMSKNAKLVKPFQPSLRLN